MKADEIEQQMTELRQYDALSDQTEYRWDFGVHGVAKKYRPDLGDEATWVAHARREAAAKLAQMTGTRRDAGDDDNTFMRVQWDGDEPVPSDDDGPDGMPLRPRGPGLSAEDLQLLTLAARAIGAERVEVVEGEAWLNLYFSDRPPAFGWNPLRHSDDTFTMMVWLRLLDEHPDFTYKLAEEQGREGADEVEAARRAATRAAAEIGKQRSS